ncbi:hypothetical protein FA13DRAFT_1716759 [Coprinellus micaceus]|uniref:Uncharacterized protein n=1 Tax=Coprinellus micaceus TaxID=71717 RepID=A0A4Y7SIU4_COPMI|nr:hypothetical protein FA13DRAFT_1716759 [Coprinellus micaceus]
MQGVRDAVRVRLPFSEPRSLGPVGSSCGRVQFDAICGGVRLPEGEGWWWMPCDGRWWRKCGEPGRVKETGSLARGGEGKPRGGGDVGTVELGWKGGVELGNGVEKELGGGIVENGFEAVYMLALPEFVASWDLDSWVPVLEIWEEARVRDGGRWKKRLREGVVGALESSRVTRRMGCGVCVALAMGRFIGVSESRRDLDSLFSLLEKGRPGLEVGTGQAREAEQKGDRLELVPLRPPSSPPLRAPYPSSLPSRFMRACILLACRRRLHSLRFLAGVEVGAVDAQAAARLVGCPFGLVIPSMCLLPARGIFTITSSFPSGIENEGEALAKRSTSKHNPYASLPSQTASPDVLVALTSGPPPALSLHAPSGLIVCRGGGIEQGCIEVAIKLMESSGSETRRDLLSTTTSTLTMASDSDRDEDEAFGHEDSLLEVCTCLVGPGLFKQNDTANYLMGFKMCPSDSSGNEPGFWVPFSGDYAASTAEFRLGLCGNAVLEQPASPAPLSGGCRFPKLKLELNYGAIHGDEVSDKDTEDTVRRASAVQAAAAWMLIQRIGCRAPLLSKFNPAPRVVAFYATSLYRQRLAAGTEPQVTLTRNRSFHPVLQARLRYLKVKRGEV